MKHGWAAAALLLLGLAALSLTQGALAAPPGELLAALWGEGSADAEAALALRGPRVAAALVVGGALATAGAAFQLLFRNPLVAPDLLGVTSGAALGAAVALLLGAGFALVQASAFVGGVVAVAVALAAAGASRGQDAMLALVLCGIVTGALASAGLALILHLADPYSQLPAISYWLLGSLARATGGEVAAAGAVAALGAAPLLLLGARLDALGEGDEGARALGLDARTMRLAAIAAATLASAAAVSLAGVVGWVGLLAPHAARLLAGPQARAWLPMSALFGAALLLLADLAARGAGAVELPLGLITAAVGAPAFLLLFATVSKAR